MQGPAIFVNPPRFQNLSNIIITIIFIHVVYVIVQALAQVPKGREAEAMEIIDDIKAGLRSVAGAVDARSTNSILSMQSIFQCILILFGCACMSRLSIRG